LTPYQVARIDLFDISDECKVGWWIERFMSDSVRAWGWKSPGLLDQIGKNRSVWKVAIFTISVISVTFWYSQYTCILANTLISTRYLQN
jgi:hypothetical protein